MNDKPTNLKRKLPSDPETPDLPEPARAGELEATVTVSNEPAVSDPVVESEGDPRLR